MDTSLGTEPVIKEYNAVEDDESPQDNRRREDNEESERRAAYPLTSIVVFMVGFSEGLTHLATLAIYYLFKDDLGLSPAQVSLLFVAPAFPCFLKPLFGKTRSPLLFLTYTFFIWYTAFYSDSYAILGMRRKPYLLFFALLEAFGFVLLGYGVRGVIGAVLSLFVIAFSASFCSAIAEALVVEVSEGQREEASSGVSDFTMAKGFGSLLVAYFSGYLLETVSKKTVFLTTAAFPLMIFFTTLLMKESRKIHKRNAAQQLVQLLVFLRQRLIWGNTISFIGAVILKKILLSLLLPFSVLSGPDYDDALFFYYTDVLDFKPSFMGTLRFTYGLAAVAGTVFYRRSLYTTSYRKWVQSAAVVYCVDLVDKYSTVSSHLPLTHPPSDRLQSKTWHFNGGFLNEAVAEIQLLPLLVLTACICPPGLEGSAYSTMLAVRNLGSALSKTSSALFMLLLGIDGTHFHHLVCFIFICGCFNLLPFFFIHHIPSDEELEIVTFKKNCPFSPDERTEILAPYIETCGARGFSFQNVP